jgi:hypothetical protein
LRQKLQHTPKIQQKEIHYHVHAFEQHNSNSQQHYQQPSQCEVNCSHSVFKNNTANPSLHQNHIFSVLLYAPLNLYIGFQYYLLLLFN